MYTAVVVAIIVVMVLALARALLGPSLYDRILAVNMFGTKTVLLIAVLGMVAGRFDFIDIALVYALINFISIIAVLRFLSTAINENRIPDEPSIGYTPVGFSCSVVAFLASLARSACFDFLTFYTRLHAASVTDTLCAGLIISGLLLQATSAMMVFKLLLILLILTYTSPTGAHALAKAAMHGGLKPVTDAKPPVSRPEQSQGESPSTL